MDRRDNTEKDVMSIETQINRAVELIMQSYNGISTELLFKEAINCFEGLMAISQNTEEFRNFKHKQEIDTKYIVDGAGYIISRMHFNPENNYYITLGLSSNATQEQIKERWKNLMMLYHPDRQVGNEEWVSERAKKVNEAYSILKDKNLRASFDLRLLDKNQKDVVTRNRHDRDSRFNMFRIRRNDSMSYSRWGKAGRLIPRILVLLYILTIIAFIGFIYLQNRSSNLETELGSGAGQKTPVIHEKPIVHSGQSLQSSSYSDRNIEMSSSAFNNKENSHSSLPAMRQVVATFQNNDRRRTVPDNQKKDDGITIKKEDKTEANKDNNDHSNNNRIDKPAVIPFRDVPQRNEDTSTGRDNIRPGLRHEVPAVKNVEKTERTLQTVMASGISREDVEKFMQSYINAYMKADLNTFMSFFSRSVIENDRLNYNDIRNAYRETFSERIDYYRIRNMDIKINGQQAIVTGVYSLNRYLSNEDRWVKYSGNITWILNSENNSLKILRINYDK